MCLGFRDTEVLESLLYYCLKLLMKKETLKPEPVHISIDGDKLI